MTANVWTDGRLELHPLPLSTLDALQNADLDKARPLLHPLVAPTKHVVSPTCVRTWKRRHRQILEDQNDAIWVTRLVVLKSTGEIIGRAGFHGQPDANGMVEIGYEIDPAYRRRGYGRAVVQIMLVVAKCDDQVRIVRASAGVDNAVSRAMILKGGFTKVGEEMDEEDGLEEVFEQSVQNPPR